MLDGSFGYSKTDSFGGDDSSSLALGACRFEEKGEERTRMVEGDGLDLRWSRARDSVFSIEGTIQMTTLCVSIEEGTLLERE